MDMNMQIAKAFMDNAKHYLTTEDFGKIYTHAINEVRKDIISSPPEKKEIKVEEKPVIKSEVPHVIERMNERYDLKVDFSDVNLILNLINNGGSNVKVKKSVINVVQHLHIMYKGQEVNVVYNKTRNKLITALPQWKKVKKYQ